MDGLEEALARLRRAVVDRVERRSTSAGPTAAPSPFAPPTSLTPPADQTPASEQSRDGRMVALIRRFRAWLGRFRR